MGKHHDDCGGLLPALSEEELVHARQRFDALIVIVRQQLQQGTTDGLGETAEELVDLACVYKLELPEDVRIAISGHVSTGALAPEGEIRAVLDAIHRANDRLLRYRMWRRVVHTQLPEEDIAPLQAALQEVERILTPHAYPPRRDDATAHRRRDP